MPLFLKSVLLADRLNSDKENRNNKGIAAAAPTLAVFDPMPFNSAKAHKQGKRQRGNRKPIGIGPKTSLVMRQNQCGSCVGCPVCLGLIQHLDLAVERAFADAQTGR